MKMTTTEIAGLTVRVLDNLPEGQEPQCAAILCHGFGAPGEDLIPIGQQLLATNPDVAKVSRWYFPSAPMNLGEIGMPWGRAWWMIDVMALNQALATGSFRDRNRNELPDGAQAARTAILGLVEHVQTDCGVGLDRVVLGGFSQGAMLSIDTAMALDGNLGGLCVFSGAMINLATWQERSVLHKGLRVLQSHGRNDPLLPFAEAEEIREMLTKWGMDVEWVEFAGEHGIPNESVDALGRMVISVAQT